MQFNKGDMFKYKEDFIVIHFSDEQYIYFSVVLGPNRDNYVRRIDKEEFSDGNLSELSDYDKYLVEHITKVRSLLLNLADDVCNRANTHDHSKFNKDEYDLFKENFKALQNATYGSMNYNRIRNKCKQAVDLHYIRNRHHPEHHKDGIRGMNLIDIMEMVVDWMVASRQSKNGNIKESIRVGQERHNFSDDLKDIITNTVDYLNESK